MSSARYLIGIDLGTSNCAVAFTEVGAEGSVRDFPILQLDRPGAVAAANLLPSALYHPTATENEEGLEMPWGKPEFVVGQFARTRGASVPGRLVTSAKSWLSHAGVDRNAAILPWTAPGDVRKISPVEASALILGHIKSAWDHEHPRDPLHEQDVVITVPASFDEVARGLTVNAVRKAGIEHFTLLEEPQAAFYHFSHRHAKTLSEILEPVRLVLVVDIGGGTTDLTLVQVAPSPEGVALKRVAVGDHLILGGDNMDSAVARRIEEKFAAQQKKLAPAQWTQLIQAAREAKESLLSSAAPEETRISIVGSGSNLLGSTLSTKLAREEVEKLILDGFLPITGPDEFPRKTGRGAIQELGLPYEAEPGISKHLAAFLRKHSRIAYEALGSPEGEIDLPRPDAILLNGGVFNSPRISERLVQVLSGWWPGKGEIPLLEHASLDLAVSRGAAHYAQVRRGKGRRIGGGSAHAFYIGVVGKEKEERPAAVCLVPRGMEEGQTVELKSRVFKLQVGRPVQFPIYSTTADRVERAGDIVEVSDEFDPLPPIQTVLKGGKDRVERIPVFLRGKLTEIGTVELWCAALETDQQWRLEFEIRGAGTDDKVLTTESLPSNYPQAKEWIEQIYGNKAKPQPGSPGPKDPKQLWSALERTLGPRISWSIAVLRQLWSDLFTHSNRRRRSAAHERVYLQLLGYALRPGFGSSLDEWRCAQTFKLFEDRVEFHKEKPNWNEFWILWRRISGGLTPEIQLELWDYLKPHFACRVPLKAPKNVSRPKGLQPEGMDEMVRAAASLEHLGPGEKQWLGDQIVERLNGSESGGGPWAWALGRLGSRVPVYGSLHTVLEPGKIEHWIRMLIQLTKGKTDGAAFALTQSSRRTGDRLRDIDPVLQGEVLEALKLAEAPEHWIKLVAEVVTLTSEEEGRVLGDTLPIGLQLTQRNLDEEPTVVPG